MDPVLARCLAKPLAAAYLVLGAETLLVTRAVEAIVARVLPEIGPPAFNRSDARASEADAIEAVGLARTLPMMAGRRLVVIRDLQEGTEEVMAAIEAYLAHPSDTTTLVLAGTGFPKVVKGGSNWSARIPKKVEAVGELVKYADGAVAPAVFAREHAAPLGHALGPDEARMLVDLCGTDLGRVAREVEKAALYVDEGAPLDGAAVTAACSALAEKDVWDLTAGIAARDREAALGALHRLLEEGDAPHRLLGLVGWQLRTVLRVAEMVRQRVPEDQIQREVRMRPDVYRKLRRALDVRQLSAAELLERLARANRAMNSVRAGDRRVFESLVLDLAAP
jgi:DNA polymerase-3 subunit delta